MEIHQSYKTNVKDAADAMAQMKWKAKLPLFMIWFLTKNMHLKFR